MALNNKTKMANRYGLNLKLTNIADSEDNAEIKFANEVSIEVTGEITWATGGQNHGKMIGFKDPREGSLKISTQIVTGELMHLIAGEKLNADGNSYSFTDNAFDALKYYKIEGYTVWQDESGNVYNEKITAWKCLPKPNYSATYNGSGDPISLDVEFELAVDADGRFLDIERSESSLEPKDISTATIAAITAQTLVDGKAEPVLTVTDGGNTLTLDTDYTVTYSNNTAVGIGVAIVKGKGNYTGSCYVGFEITA